MEYSRDYLVRQLNSIGFDGDSNSKVLNYIDTCSLSKKDEVLKQFIDDIEPLYMLNTKLELTDQDTCKWFINFYTPDNDDFDCNFKTRLSFTIGKLGNKFVVSSNMHNIKFTHLITNRIFNDTARYHIDLRRDIYGDIVNLGISNMALKNLYESDRVEFLPNTKYCKQLLNMYKKELNSLYFGHTDDDLYFRRKFLGNVNTCNLFRKECEKFYNLANYTCGLIGIKEQEQSMNNLHEIFNVLNRFDKVLEDNIAMDRKDIDKKLKYLLHMVNWVIDSLDDYDEQLKNSGGTVENVENKVEYLQKMINTLESRYVEVELKEDSSDSNYIRIRQYVTANADKIIAGMYKENNTMFIGKIRANDIDKWIGYFVGIYNYIVKARLMDVKEHIEISLDSEIENVRIKLCYINKSITINDKLKNLYIDGDLLENVATDKLGIRVDIRSVEDFELHDIRYADWLNVNVIQKSGGNVLLNKKMLLQAENMIYESLCGVLNKIQVELELIRLSKNIFKQHLIMMENSRKSVEAYEIYAKIRVPKSKKDMSECRMNISRLAYLLKDYENRKREQQA